MNNPPRPETVNTLLLRTLGGGCLLAIGFWVIIAALVATSFSLSSGSQGGGVLMNIRLSMGAEGVFLNLPKPMVG